MSDKLVLVATFSLPVEAQLARGRLEADGIKALLGGDESVNVFSGIQGVGGKLTLHVAEADAERAAAILAEHLDKADDDGDAGRADDALWLCPLCGDAVRDDLDVCPACQTPRPEARKSRAVTSGPRRGPDSPDIQQTPTTTPAEITADTPIEAVPSAVEGDLDIPDPETFLGDDLVRRAFISSLFGVLAPYSIWLLGRLAFYPGKISPRMMLRLYLTIAIDLFWCVAFLLLFCFGLLPPRRF
jgi:hypothetical protein